MFNERSEPIMLITCWYLCFPVSQALCFAIHCRCLASRCLASSPLAFFMILSLTLCLCFLFRSCLLFTLIPSTISHLWNQPCRARWCSRQYADAVLTLLCSFIERDGSAHIYYIYIYIYIHIQTLAQNRTAVIKIIVASLHLAIIDVSQARYRILRGESKPPFFFDILQPQSQHHLR